MAFYPDDSVQPPPLKKKGRTMPPEDPNDRAGMMEWLKQVPPPNTSWPVPLGTDDHKGPVAGPFTKIESVQAPAPKMPAAPSPLGVGAGRVKELDDMLMKRVADTAPVPAPQSPYERDVTEGLPAIRAIMGNQVGHMDRRGGNFVPGLADRPEDIAFRRAMEAHQIDATQKMAQRQALTGAMEVAPKMLPGEAEASKVAFMQSPEGATQMAVSGMLAGGMSPEQVALVAPQLKNLPGFAPKAVPGQQQGPPLPSDAPPADPVAALGLANPSFLASVYDPRTRKYTDDAKTIDQFMSKAFAVENGKFLERNFPALQEYANTMYGKDSIKDRVTSSPMMQAAERKFPMFAGLRMTPPHALGLMAQGIDPLSPEGQAMALRQQQVPLMERIWGGLGVGEKEREQNAAWRAALNRYLQSSPSGSTGTTPPLQPRR